jgi:hypothetical protein
LQRHQEGGHFVKGQGGMVRDFADLGTRGEEMREATFPLRRVWPFSVASDGRGVEHRLNPSSHPTRRLRLHGPDRIEHLHD